MPASERPPESIQSAGFGVFAAERPVCTTEVYLEGAARLRRTQMERNCLPSLGTHKQFVKGSAYHLLLTDYKC